MITPATDLQATPQWVDGLKAQSSQTHGNDDAGEFGAAFTASLAATQTTVGSTPRGDGVQDLAKQLPASAQSSTATSASVLRGASSAVHGATNQRQPQQSLALVLMSKGTVTGSENAISDGAGSVSASALPAKVLSSEQVALPPRVVVPDDVAPVVQLDIVKDEADKGDVASAAAGVPPAPQTAAALAIQTSVHKPTSTVLSETQNKSGVEVTKSKASAHVAVSSDPSTANSLGAIQIAASVPAELPIIAVQIPEAAPVVPSPASNPAVTPVDGVVLGQSFVSLPNQNAQSDSVPLVRSSPVSSIAAPTSHASSQLIAAWNTEEQATRPSNAVVAETSLSNSGKTSVVSPAKLTEGEEAVALQTQPASANNADNWIAANLPGTLSSSAPVSDEQASPAFALVTATVDIAKTSGSVPGNVQTVTQISTSVSPTSSASAHSLARSEIQNLHAGVPTRQGTPVGTSASSASVAPSRDISGSELRYAIGTVSDGLTSVRGTHDGLRSAPPLPGTQTRTTAVSGAKASSQTLVTTARPGSLELSNALSAVGVSLQLQSGNETDPSTESTRDDSATATAVTHVGSPSPAASAHNSSVATGELAPLPANLTVPAVVLRHEPFSPTSVQAVSGSPTSSAQQSVVTEGVAGTGALSTSLSSHTHQTLAATPTSLEVGVHSGSQGWLKIRAEVGDQGEVKASLAATSAGGDQMLKGQLPALNAYLHSEQMSVTTTVAERIGTGHGASTHDLSLGGSGSSSGSGSGGQDASLLQRGQEQSGFEQSGRRSADTSASASSQGSDDAAQSYASRQSSIVPSLPQAERDGSGRWLNVTV